MEDNFDNTYDYLSQLRSGFNGSPLPRSSSAFSGGSTHNSDPESDNECIIIEVKIQSKDETECEPKESRPTVESLPSDPKSLPKDVTSEVSRTPTTSISDTSEYRPESDEDFDSSDAESSDDERLVSSDISSKLIKIINNIRYFGRQRLTFTRILAKFRQLEEVEHKSDPNSYLKSVLNDCIKRGIIEENQKDGKEVAFFPINANKSTKRQLKRCHTLSDSDFDSDDCIVIDSIDIKSKDTKGPIGSRNEKAKSLPKALNSKTRRPLSLHKSDTSDNELSIANKDLVSQDSTKSSDESHNSSDISSEVIKIIEKIRMISKGRPTFDRILFRFKTLKEVSHRSDASDYLMEVLNDCIQRGIIEENEKDDKELAYFPINANTFGNSPHKRCASSDGPIISPKRQRISETISVRSDGDHNSKTVIKAVDLKSLPTDDYIDISDIDVSSARDMFKDTELSPEFFDRYGMRSRTQSPISLSLNSSPIKSFNHNRNKEVLRKQLFSPSDQNSEQLEATVNYNNWLMETLPRYSPFIAQKGDKVVYLKDAHNIHIDYELKELLELYPNYYSTKEEIETAIGSNDYTINAIVSEVKFYEINDIIFSLIQLKNQSNAKPFKFNVVYRPNRGICEFLVLENLYKQSLTREWKKGEKFRSLWKDFWWIGVVNNKSIFDDKYPESLFKCFEVKWNTGVKGRLSPWNLFPVDNKRLPSDDKNGVVVIRKDLLSINYRPTPSEWPVDDEPSIEKWRCYECKRIYWTIKFIENKVSPNIVSNFKEFNNKSISYPVNLQLIKERLKNMFYRRKESVIRDITQLKANVKLDLLRSLVVRKEDLKVCEEFVDLLLSICEDCQSFKGNEFTLKHINKYKHLMDEYLDKSDVSPSKQSSDRINAKTMTPVTQKVRPIVSTSSNLNVSNISENQSKSDSQKKSQEKRNYSQTPSASEPKVTKSIQWKLDSQKYVNWLQNNRDSEGYRQPVAVEYPSYSHLIPKPIDLSQIISKLNSNQYLNPMELRDDFNHMYENTRVLDRVINDNKKSKMGLINEHLIRMTEEKLGLIIKDWEGVQNIVKLLKQ